MRPRPGSHAIDGFSVHGLNRAQSNHANSIAARPALCVAYHRVAAMTSEEKRQLKKQGKLIVEKRSAVLHKATSSILSLSHRATKANEQWLSEHREHITAAEVSKRFVVTSAVELGWPSPFIECLKCHDVLHSYPDESTKCSCGSLSVTFGKTRRGNPPKISACGEKARTVVLMSKG